MARTLAQARTDVRSRLDEATASFWSDTELTRWINEGQNDVARRSECLRATSDIAVTAGTQDYVAPTDLVRATAAEWRPTSSDQRFPLTYLDRHNADSIWGTSQSMTDGTPAIWTAWGYPGTSTFTIKLYPTPYEAGTLRLYYYKLPTEVAADGDTLGVPNGWEDLVVEYATMLAYRKDGNQQWQDAFQKYTADLEALIETAVRFSDQAGHIDGMGPLAPTWLYAGDGSW